MSRDPFLALKKSCWKSMSRRRHPGHDTHVSHIPNAISLVISNFMGCICQQQGYSRLSTWDPHPSKAILSPYLLLQPLDPGRQLPAMSFLKTFWVFAIQACRPAFSKEFYKREVKLLCLVVLRMYFPFGP